MPFSPVDTTPGPPKRIVAAITGLPKEGKTRLALDFPPPVYLFNFDQGYEDMVKGGHFEGKEIYHSDYLLPEEFDLATYLPMSKAFRKEWAETCELAGARGGTVVIDTASQMDKLVRDTERERVEAERYTKLVAKGKGEKYVEMQTSWGSGNLMMGSILRRPFQVPGLNAVFIQRMKEVYDAGGRATGTHVMHGFAETECIVNMLIRMSSKTAVVDGKSVTEMYGTLEVCRIDEARPYLGMPIKNLSYEKLREMVTP